MLHTKRHHERNSPCSPSIDICYEWNFSVVSMSGCVILDRLEVAKDDPTFVSEHITLQFLAQFALGL